MLTVIAALLGAAVTLIAAWGAGEWLARRLHLPIVLRFAIGAAVLSCGIFFLLCLHLANAVGFGALAVLGAALVYRYRRPAGLPSAPKWVWVSAAIYGLVYLAYALTPEVQSDAVTYHLSLATSAKRSGGFPSRIGFYEVLPQGVETLFAMAYSFGGEPAAKLVHLSFLFLTVPLAAVIAQSLALQPLLGWMAGLMYAFTPVAGVSSTAAYNDAAITFYVLATFALLLQWWKTTTKELLLPLGICCGFCYAIKFTGVIVLPAVVAAMLWRTRRLPSWTFWIAAVSIAGLWIARSAILTGNPIAPLGNAIFPNPYFHIESEEKLGQYLRRYGDVEWATIPLELTVYGDLLQGLLSPVWLIAPAGLLALRKVSGRVLIAAAFVAGLPWFFNIGTRFLMPALPLAALAIMLSVGPRIGVLLVVAQAVLSFPPLVQKYAPSGVWALDTEIPWKAALRLEPESDYLERMSADAGMRHLIEKNTKRGDKIFDMANAPAAVLDREFVNAWQEAKGDRLVHDLHLGMRADTGMLVEWRSVFPEREFTSIRLEFLSGQPDAARIEEIRIFDGKGERLRPNVLWSLTASPNIWDAALVVDGNVVSGWSTFQAVKPGMHVEVDFGGPKRVAEVRVIGHRSVVNLKLGLSGGFGERREKLPLDEQPRNWPALNLRMQATQLLRREAITHVLGSVGSDALGVITQDMRDDPRSWGLQAVGIEGAVYLFRVTE